MEPGKRLRASTLALFCAVPVLRSAPALADDATATETAAARALAVDGLKLAQSGNCTDAVPKLERAEKLYHSPVVASRLGECYVSLGRLVEGTEILRKVLREPQPAEPTPALAKALERAQHTLDAAKPRIAGLTVKVAAVQDMTVKIDGNVVPPALVDTEIPTDPGEHAIEVTAPGFLRSSTRVSVNEAEKKSVTVTLARDPNAVVTPVAVAPPAEAGREPATSRRTSPPAPQPAPAPPRASQPTSNHTAAYVALGVGATALATGGVLGLMTMQRHSQLEKQCTGGVCPVSAQGDYDAAKRLGNFSTVAFGVAGAGLAVGTVLLFIQGPNDVHDAAARQPRIAGFTRPRLAVGPSQIQLGADF